MNAEQEKGYIKYGQMLLHYHSCGKGFPLILLHGNMQNSSFFEKQVEFFKEYYRVIKASYVTGAIIPMDGGFNPI